MNRTKLVSLALALALIFSLAACGTPADSVSPGPDSVSAAFPGTPDADMVTLNITTEPRDINPLRFGETISQSVLFHCMSGLTRLDKNDQPVADIAESWDINEDRTVYTMHLRNDAKWSNGDPVTAHDFYYSWLMQLTPSTGTIMAPFLYQNILGGDAFYRGEADESELGLAILDDYTLEITWSHPMANGLFYLAQPFFFPINQKAYEQIGDTAYAKEADAMVTNGAYRITEWVHSSYMLLEKNPDYHGADQVKIPKLKLAMIGDANTSLNAFMVGELDMCNLFSEQIAQVTQRDESTATSYIDGASYYINFNLQDEYLSNLNLRKALAYSVDVQSLLDYVINDGSIAADGFVPGIISGLDGKSYAEARGSLFAYDKEAAQGYFQKALEELNLTAAELKLSFYGTDTTYNQNQAAYLQQQWKENLGLDVELKPMPAAALYDAKLSGDYSFCVDAWGPSENDAITFLEMFDSENMSNYSKYADAEYDALVRGSAQEPDAEARQSMLVEAEKMLIDEMVLGPLYFTCTAYAVSDKLEGLVRTPFQFFSVMDASIKG